MEMLPLQAGDVPDTEANVSALVQATGYAPRVDVRSGVRHFVDWYRAYYRA
jgi:UDP-glucuronate 4-epimerase